MAFNRIHPQARANKLETSDFGQVADAIDQAERSAGDRIGGPKAGERAAVGRLERSLPRPVTASDWEWLARRLARALENGWARPATAKLLRLAM